MRRIPELYLRFGFAPYLRSEAEEAAWRTITPYLKSA
jgi:hypothetical protein